MEVNLTIAYPIAKDESGNWVEIEKALAGNKYYCPECQSRMVAKLGMIKRHHFAHLTQTIHSCTGESGWHSLAKQVLAYTLEKLGEVRYTTSCSYKWDVGCSAKACQSIFHRDRIQNIVIEKNIDDSMRPDVTINLKNGSIIYGEIVYRNQVTPSKYAKYVSDAAPLLLWVLDKQNPATEVPFISNQAISHLYYGETHKPEDNEPGIFIYTDRLTHKSEKCPPILDESIIVVYGYLKPCPNCSKEIFMPLFTPNMERYFEPTETTYFGNLELYYLKGFRTDWNFINYANRILGSKIRMSKKGNLYHLCHYCEAYLDFQSIKNDLMGLSTTSLIMKKLNMIKFGRRDISGVESLARAIELDEIMKKG